jgi:CYTH domain-containing protein
MPIENERKFVLLDDGKLEQQLARAPGVTRSLLRQAYLDVSGLRIRAIDTDGTKRHDFTYKQEVEGQVVEVERRGVGTHRVGVALVRRETLQKARYSWPDGRFHWDVDFFKTDEGRTYFAQAEVEMPEGDRTPPPLPPPLAGHLLALAPAGDLRFTSKRLANRTHAESLLADIRTKGKIE